MGIFILPPPPLLSPLQGRPVARRVAAASSTNKFDADEIVKTLSDKWEATENKPQAAAYAGGALVALWITTTVIGAVNAIPLMPRIMELVGLGYTTWFVYRYLLFKDSRSELSSDIDEIKEKISGTFSDI